jgi:hypothetical protein
VYLLPGTATERTIGVPTARQCDRKDNWCTYCQAMRQKGQFVCLLPGTAPERTIALKRDLNLDNKEFKKRLVLTP